MESTKNINSSKEIRFKDQHGHFLGKIENGLVYIYCKRCKEFYLLKSEGGGDEIKLSSC